MRARACVLCGPVSRGFDFYKGRKTAGETSAPGTESYGDGPHLRTTGSDCRTETDRRPESTGTNV